MTPSLEPEFEGLESEDLHLSALAERVEKLLTLVDTLREENRNLTKKIELMERGEHNHQNQPEIEKLENQLTELKKENKLLKEKEKLIKNKVERLAVKLDKLDV